MPRKRRLLQQRKELVDRYVRIAVHRKVRRIAHALARRLSRTRLQSERKRKKPQISALQTTAAEAARTRRHDTPDGNPIVGVDPRVDGLIVAAGLSGQGFKFAPVFGQEIAALIDGGKMHADLDQFEVSRLLD
ncbi:FAD-dependent oxidoreductase [uncultured Paraburkholderia sp.]|uniref:FAD-dependent oxidoreductase n=1 Tax=uncultured Paraburkholderia sp. TaxID=1822466 RepID=UPI00259A311B|nr:FAD-dependent oxidoreductase [uncultured Paraburkholderia sp.]